MERTENTEKDRLNKASFWFGTRYAGRLTYQFWQESSNLLHIIAVGLTEPIIARASPTLVY